MKHTTAILAARIKAQLASRERGLEALQIAIAAAVLGAITVALAAAYGGKVTELMGTISGL